jgi:hypothetical protein
MKQKEFEQKVTGLVNILQESDIVTRSIELSKKGKKEIKEKSYSTKISYDYFFKSIDEKHVIYIEKRDIGAYGEHEEVTVKYNGKIVLNAVECFSENVPKIQFIVQNKSFSHYNNDLEMCLFVKKSKNNKYYKIIKYQKGEWENVINLIEKGEIQEYKKPEPIKEEPEINSEYVKLLNENFNI